MVHSQVGLAAEYLGRYFTSLDGLSYCEIVDEPEEIEVVAVDPHCDRRPLSAEKRPGAGRAIAKGKRASKGAKEGTWGSYLENRSFETCMHGSLHCVLGYSSQVMAPSYKRAAEREAKATGFPVAARTSAAKGSATSLLDRSYSTEEAKLLEGYAIAMAQSVQSKSAMMSNNASGSTRRVVSSTVASSSSSSSTAACVSAEQRLSTTRVDSSRANAQSGWVNLPAALRGFPNASLVLLKSAGARTGGEEQRSLCKAKDASVGDETLSSIYKKWVSANESTASREDSSPARSSSFYTLKRHAVSMPREYAAKRTTVLEGQLLENARTVQVTRKSDESASSSSANDTKIKPPDGGGALVTSSSSKNRAWCTSETSEIARILSEYNRSTTKKSAIQIYGPASRSVKANLASASAKGALTKTTFLWQKDGTAEASRNASNERSVGLDLSQGKWKRPPTFEKVRDVWIADQNVWSGYSVSSESRQTSKDPQASSSSSYTREKAVVVARKDLDEPRREIVAADAKPKGAATAERSKDAERSETSKTKTQEEDSLQELLENTAILYCAANGVHQDDLSSYIDTLDSKQSIQWLESWNNSVV